MNSFSHLIWLPILFWVVCMAILFGAVVAMDKFRQGVRDRMQLARGFEVKLTGQPVAEKRENDHG